MSFDADINAPVAPGSRRPPANSPERGRVPVAEEGAGSTGEDRCHPLSAQGQLRSAKREYAPANRMKPTLANSMFDRLGMPAEIEQLASGDNTVLIGRQLPDGARRLLDAFGVHRHPRRPDVVTRPPRDQRGAAAATAGR